MAILITSLGANKPVKIEDTEKLSVSYFQPAITIAQKNILPIDSILITDGNKNLYVKFSDVTTPAGPWTAETLALHLNTNFFYDASSGGGGGGSIVGFNLETTQVDVKNTLSAVKAKTDNLDVPLSNVNNTLSAVKAKTDNIDVPLSNLNNTLSSVKAKTDNLDVALSSRASESALVSGLTLESNFNQFANAASTVIFTPRNSDSKFIRIYISPTDTNTYRFEGKLGTTIDNIYVPIFCYTEKGEKKRTARGSTFGSIYFVEVTGFLDVRMSVFNNSGQPYPKSVYSSFGNSLPLGFEKAKPATFTVVGSAIAGAANKSMILLWNSNVTFNAVSAVKVKIQSIKIINAQNSAIAGTPVTFELHRIINAVGFGGTIINAQLHDSESTVLAAPQVVTGGTVLPANEIFLGKYSFSNDEWSSGAQDVESSDHIIQTNIRLYDAKDSETPITINANEGFHIKQATATALGTWDFLITYTVETLT